MTRDSRATTMAGSGRLEHLDALRGLAALVVVLHHALLSLPAGDPLPSALRAVALLRVVELGRPAVILFFVLSGFVLAICLEPARDTVVGFAIRRALRLLPPYWVAILVSFILFRAISHQHAPGFSTWLVSQWDVPLSGGDLARHLAMLAGPRQFPLDHVAWSLVHELRLSLAVPLLVLVAARRGGTACLALATAASLAASLVVTASPDLFPRGFHGYRFDAEGLAPSLVLSARYALPFAVGVVLARHRATLATWLAGRRLALPLGLAASLTLLSQPSEPMMAIGGAALIGLVACSAACARVLASAPLVWLGRTSYSLYLVHLPVMLACAFALEGRLAPRAILALAIIVALALAELMFRLVEQPSIRWSRSAGRALAMPAPAPALAAVAPLVAEA